MKAFHLAISGGLFVVLSGRRNGCPSERTGLSSARESTFAHAHGAGPTQDSFIEDYQGCIGFFASIAKEGTVSFYAP